MKKRLSVLALAATCLAVPVGALSGCASVKVEPIEVNPIEINLNVRVQVEKELDNFFGDLDAQASEISN